MVAGQITTQKTRAFYTNLKKAHKNVLCARQVNISLPFYAFYLEMYQTVYNYNYPLRLAKSFYQYSEELTL